MSQIATDPARRHRLSVAEYYRMAEVGILQPDARVELIDGEIIDMAPIGSRHNAIVDRLARTLQQAVRDLAIVRTQGSVSLGSYSEPHPDIALLRPHADSYFTAQPGASEICLIVEVADSSLAFDRDVKVPLYARHQLAEMWLIDIEHRRLKRHRHPSPDRYALIDEPSLQSPLSVSTIAGVAIDLSTLFPP